MSRLPPARYLDPTTPPHITTLVLVAGVAALSMNLFLPSLPAMASYFGVDYPVMQMSITLYLVATAIIQALIGPFADRYGRRVVMLIVMTIFVLASLGAMLAATFEIFLACRLLQAVVSTGFVLSRAVVRDIVEEARAASMIGYVTMGMSLVPMVAPLLGGVLQSAFGWQSSFMVLSLAGMAMLWLIWRDMGETAPKRSGGLAAQLRDYPPLLRSQLFWAYCAIATLASGAFFAYLGGAPYASSTYFGLSPELMGFYFGAPAIGYMLGNFLSARYASRYGIIRMITWGALLEACGMLILSGFAAIDLAGANLFFAMIFFIGLGNGLIIPNANAGLLSVQPKLAGSAAGLGGSMMIGGGAILSALAGVVQGPETGILPLSLLIFLSTAACMPCLWWIKSAKLRA